MSYQFELPRVTKAHLADALRVKAEEWAARTSMSDEERQALLDHVQGITGGIDILQSWMGGDDVDVRVVVTGHANPAHKPREGYSDEHITISIGVLPATEVGAVSDEPEPVVLQADPQEMDRLVADLEYPEATWDRVAGS